MEACVKQWLQPRGMGRPGSSQDISSGRMGEVQVACQSTATELGRFGGEAQLRDSP
jgi:hypothetical protein